MNFVTKKLFSAVDKAAEFMWFINDIRGFMLSQVYFIWRQVIAKNVSILQFIYSWVKLFVIVQSQVEILLVL
jgi:hypothetical protein